MKELGPLLRRAASEEVDDITDRYRSLASDRLDALDDSMAALETTFVDQHDAYYVEASSEAEYERAHIHLLALVRGHQLHSLRAQSGPATSASSASATHELRGQALAETTAWALRQFPDNRMIAWTENIQANRDPEPTLHAVGDLEVSLGTTMAGRLSQAIGSDLRVVFTSHALGPDMDSAASIESSDLADDALERVLAELGHEQFYLDLRNSGRDPAASSWATVAHPMRASLGTVTLTPAHACDAIFQVMSTTPTRARAR